MAQRHGTSSSPSSSWWAFVAGCMTAYAGVAIARTGFLERIRHWMSSSSSSLSSLSRQLPHQHKDDAILMDSPLLDKRVIRKAEGVIQMRTSRLLVVVERCTNDFNYSAILRTAEALGVQHVWIIAPPQQSTLVMEDGEEEDNMAEEDNGEELEDEGPRASAANGSSHSMHSDDVAATQQTTSTAADDTAPKSSSSKTKTKKKKLLRSTGQVIKRASASDVAERELHHLFAQRATEYLSVRSFDDTTSCLSELRRQGFTVWATDLSQKAISLTPLGLREYYAQNPRAARNSPDSWLPPKLAIVFGTEAVGCTQEMLMGADLTVYLPLRGFADSLNLSVATALVLHQLFLLEPELVGSMSEEERRALRQVWFVQLARQRLLTSGQKRQMTRLQQWIQTHEAMEQRLDIPVGSQGYLLPNQRHQILEELPRKRQQLAQLQQDLEEKAQAAVQDEIRHPPAPLTDLRRCDEHRECFVGKNTRKAHAEEWSQMAATARHVTSTERGEFHAVAPSNALFRKRNGGSDKTGTEKISSDT